MGAVKSERAVETSCYYFRFVAGGYKSSRGVIFGPAVLFLILFFLSPTIFPSGNYCRMANQHYNIPFRMNMVCIRRLYSLSFSNKLSRKILRNMTLFSLSALISTEYWHNVINDFMILASSSSGVIQLGDPQTRFHIGV